MGSLDCRATEVLLSPQDEHLRAVLQLNERRGVKYVAMRNQHRTPLHSYLLQPPSGMFVDHVNNNPMDNRRENLRLCTMEQNNQNRRRPAKPTRFKYKGVRAHRDRFSAILKANHRRHYLGTFGTQEEAARAYDAGAIRLHGEFASLNFPV